MSMRIEERINRLERIVKREGFFSDLKQSWSDDLHGLMDPDNNLIDDCEDIISNMFNDCKSAMRLAKKTDNDELIAKVQDVLDSISCTRNCLSKLSD